VGLAKADAGIGQHFTQTMQRIFQRLADCRIGRGKYGGSLIAIHRQRDLDATELGRVQHQIRLLTESLEGRVEQIIGYASGDAIQSDLAATTDLREADTNPVLKLETFLRRSLRDAANG